MIKCLMVNFEKINMLLVNLISKVTPRIDNEKAMLYAKNSTRLKINRQQHDSGFSRECLELFCISN